MAAYPSLHYTPGSCVQAIVMVCLSRTSKMKRDPTRAVSECYFNPGALSCRLAEHIASPSFTDLSDLVRRQTGSAAYLDSNDLVDLRTLFNEGDVHTFSHTPTRAHGRSIRTLVHE